MDSATGTIILERALDQGFSAMGRRVDHLIEWAERKGLDDRLEGLRATRVELEELAGRARNRVLAP